MSRLLGIAIAYTVLASATAQAQIEAHFTDGTGTGSSDQYTGTAGNGWAGGWAFSSATGTGVQNSSPLNGGGNYLSILNSATGGVENPTAGGTSVVRRQFTSFDGVTPTSAYRITWDARFDGNMAHMTGFNDRIHFFGDVTGAGGTGVSNTWGIGWAAADNGTTNDIHQGNWYFYDNNGSTAFSGANMFNTGMGLTAGTEYSFVVEVDPTTGLYNASIFDGVTTVSANDLTFRRGAGDISASPSFLHFGTNRSAATDDLTLSIDSITITAVPEPSTWLMLGLSALFGAYRWRRS